MDEVSRIEGAGGIWKSMHGGYGGIAAECEDYSGGGWWIYYVLDREVVQRRKDLLYGELMDNFPLPPL